ncbi:MAG: nuclear transport factor 2 family protein [Actinomycetota bacterium]|nr:nuclear transport factor 2 family protein [Actinomycetota bacterium]
MTEENAELAVRIIHNLETLFEHLAPDVVWDNTVGSPPDHSGLIRGKAAVEKIIREWVSSWSEYRISVNEVVEAGNDVILDVSESGFGRESGVPLEHRHCYLWSFRDGLIVSGSEYASKTAALGAIKGGRLTDEGELSPPPSSG